MENPLQFGTLNSNSMLKFTRLRPRRSHLDSASYRALVQIFSLCLDDETHDSSQEPIADPNSETSGDLLADRNAGEVPKGSSFENPRYGGDDGDMEMGETKENEPCACDGGIEEGTAFTDSKPDLDLLHDEFYIDDCLDMEFIDNIMSDWSELLDAKDGLLNTESEEPKFHGSDLACCSERGNEVMESKVSQVEMRSEGFGADSVKDSATLNINFKSTEDTRVTADQETQIHIEVPNCTVSRDVMVSSSNELNQLEGSNREHAEVLEFEKPAVVEEVNDPLIYSRAAIALEEQVDELNQMEGSNQEHAKVLDFEKPAVVEVVDDPLVDSCAASTLEQQVDDADMEEGEIPNEFEISSESLDLVHDDAILEGRKLEEPELVSSAFTPNNVLFDSKLPIKHAIDGDEFVKSQIDTSPINVSKGVAKYKTVDPHALRFPEEESEALASDSEENISDTKVKRKRAPLTEKRKAKKKIAKKRKKAQKDREQGVKRMKLQPVVKPKIVKDCEFYLKGKCQKGALCKFSHDATPLTKSQPCSHFARNSCLKGDDCPFNHQLSDFPCHNFLSTGMCVRGNKCKFSHERPSTEGSSPSPIAGALSSSGNSNLVKQLNMSSNSLSATGRPKSTTSSMQFNIPKPFVANLLNSPKKPIQMPNGICFLSFGKGPLDDSSNKKGSFPVGKNDNTCHQQNQGTLLGSGRRNLSTLSHKSSTAVEYEANTRSSQTVCSRATNTNARKDFSKSICGSDQTGVPSRIIQNEVSEASKILEEFLFCGSS